MGGMSMNKFLMALFFAIFSASALADAVFSWSLVPAAEPGDGTTRGYRFYLEQTPIGSGPFTPAASIAGPPFDATPHITQDVEYEAWVKSFNENGESSDSNHIRFTDTGAPDLIVLPAPPSTISFAGTMLSWSASPGDGYYVYAVPTPIGAGPFVPVADVAGTSYDLASHVAEDTQYETWVATHNTIGTSWDSTHIRFALGGAVQVITLPSAPAGFSVTWPASP